MGEAKAAAEAELETRKRALKIHRNLEVALQRGLWYGVDAPFIAELLQFTRATVETHLKLVRELEPEFENAEEHKSNPSEK